MSRPSATSATYAAREVRDAAPAEWDGWLRSSPGGGHALQSHAWSEFKSRRGWKPVRVVLEKDGEIAGLGQFLTYNTFPVPGRLMYCTKGPWLPWDDPEAVRTFFEGVSAVARREGAHTVKIEPEVLDECSDIKAMLGDLGFRKARYDLNFSSTVVMDLTPSEEDLLAGMKGKKGKTTRYNIRRAEKEGVAVSEPEDFDRAFETFYSWMQGLAGRKEGFNITRPREYFYDVMKTMNEAGEGRFFFAEYEGEPLAGAYVFNFGGKMWQMYGASPQKGHKLQPAYALQWGMIRWARDHGIGYYDLAGIPKPENRNEDDPYYGVYRFKLGFGGDEVEFIGCLDLPLSPARAAAWYNLEPTYYRLYQRLKHNVFY